jgi:hypothetical protein
MLGGVAPLGRGRGKGPFPLPRTARTGHWGPLPGQISRQANYLWMGRRTGASDARQRPPAYAQWAKVASCYPDFLGPRNPSG